MDLVVMLLGHSYDRPLSLLLPHPMLKIGVTGVAV